MVLAACGGRARRKRRLVSHHYAECRAHITWLQQQGLCVEIGACDPGEVCGDLTGAD